MYEASLGGIEEQLLERTPDGNLFVNEMTTGGQTIGKMDHLVCFLPGVIALSADAGAVSATSDVGRIPAAQRTVADLAAEKARLMQEAHDLVSTCVKFYNMTPTGTRHEGTAIISAAGGMHSPLQSQEKNTQNFISFPSFLTVFECATAQDLPQKSPASMPRAVPR